MSGPSETPSAYVHQRRVLEAQTCRRLEIVNILRVDPAATNKKLAKALKVSRNTITLDRRAIMEELKNKTLNETELLRAEMVGKLEHLNAELEKHRKDGKLPVSVIHEALLVTRSIIELLGVRKPVVEKLEVRKRTISFQTTIVPTNQGTPIKEPKVFEVTRQHLALGEG